MVPKMGTMETVKNTIIYAYRLLLYTFKTVFNDVPHVFEEKKFSSSKFSPRHVSRLNVRDTPKNNIKSARNLFYGVFEVEKDDNWRFEEIFSLGGPRVKKSIIKKSSK